jgi:diacylglycerol kinase (ATP)
MVRARLGVLENAIPVRRVSVILNPHADRWRARSRRSEVEQALGAAGLTFDLAETSGPGHAIDLSRQSARSGADAIVAAGGDGTVSEVVNGLLEGQPADPPPLGLLPLGAGNDFAAMLGVPRSLRKAARIIARGRLRRVDVGRANDRWFANNAGLGMEPLVTIESTRVRRLRGNVRYAVALVLALKRLHAWQMHVEWDGDSFAGPAYLVSVCNSRRTGGIFPMAPRAEIDDGRLDLVLVPRVRKVEVLSLLGRLARGVHVDDPRVTYVRSRRVHVRSDPPSPLHADGEVLTEGIREVRFSIRPRLLGVLAPSDAQGG